jgi:hypothetical protein
MYRFAVVVVIARKVARVAFWLLVLVGLCVVVSCVAGAIVGCGGAFSSLADVDAGDASADVVVDVDQADGGHLVDVQSTGDVEQLHDAGADVVDEQPVEGSADVEACAPLAFPLPPPQGCTADEGPPITAPGRVWVSDAAGQCWSAALAGSADCEGTACAYSCACLGPALAAAGWGGQCVDAARGPVWEE